MLLRTKLISSFVGGLLLTMLLSFVAWYGMNTMEGRSQQAVLLENTSIALLRANVAQLRFLYSSDRTEIDLARQFITDTQHLLLEATNNSVNNDEVRNLESLSAKVKDYAARFAVLVQQTDAIGDDDSRIMLVVKDIYNNFEAMRSRLDAGLRAVFTPEQFTAYNRLAQARVEFEQARIAMWRYRACPPTLENFNAATAAVNASAESLADVTALSQDAELKELLGNTQKQLLTYQATFKKLLTARETQQSTLADIRAFIMSMVDDLLFEANHAADNLHKAQTDARVQLLAISVIVALLGLFAAILLINSVLHQLGKDPGELAAIARRVTDGDTAVALEYADANQYRGVFRDLLLMVRSLLEHLELVKKESHNAQEQSARAMEAVKQAEASRKQAETAKSEGMLDAARSLDVIVNVVNAAASSLSAQLSSAEHGAVEQADRMTETAGAMEEMNVTMVEVARNTASAAEVSAVMRDRAENGSRIMDTAVNGIRTVRDQASAVRASMAALTENMGSINQILAVITDIADQTNLLALNAAIEAARAGESGRGFAVVADEVRKLAEKTMASTTDVANVIKTIRLSAEENMRQVDATVSEIEKANTLVAQSGTVLEEIASLVDNTADQVRAIATASEEQSATSESINHAMTQVNTIALNTASSMRSAALAVNSLVEQSHALVKLISDMKNG